MSLDGLYSSKSLRQIDHPKYTKLGTYTITLDDIFQYYFKESFFEDVICETCSLFSSEAGKKNHILRRFEITPFSFEYNHENRNV